MLHKRWIQIYSSRYRDILDLGQNISGARKLSLRILLCVLCVLSVAGARAQNEAQISMYHAVPTFYNPAAAGQDSSLHISAFHRMQWMGVENAPTTFFFGADLPFKFMKRQHGAGLTLANDKAGLFGTTSFGFQYVFRTKKFWGGILSVGIELGGINQSFSGGEIYIPDGEAWEPSDDALPTGDVSAMAFDCSAGLRYSHDLFYAGLSARHLTQPVLDLDEFAYSEQARVFYFEAGCNIPIRRSLYILQPSLLVKTTLGMTQVDYTIRAMYDQKFWGGLTFRPKDAVVLMAGMKLKSFMVGYAYDIGISPLANASGGSHEIMATYTLKMDLDKKTKHRHKSIRIL